MAGLKNLLLVVIDCLGSDTLLGDRKSAVTPNMDALRGRGVTFPNTITAATYTTPSFASLLTGLYPSAHGVRSLGSHKLPTGCATLAGILTEQGYQTAAFLTGPLGKETAIGNGFDHFEHRDPEDVSFGPWGQEFLASFPSKLREPWFVLLHLWELHPPRYVAPTCQPGEYGRTTYDRALSGVDVFMGQVLGGIDQAGTVIVLTADHGEKLAQPVHTRLRSTVRWVIDHAGPARPILEAARKSRLVPNKVRHFGITTHGYHVYDVLARVPLVMVDSDRLDSPKTVTQQVRTIDILPTVLDLLSPSLSGRYGFQGESLLPLASGNHVDLPPAVVEAHVSVRMNTGLLVGLRTPKWKLAFAADKPALPWELYDLTTDPEEKRNVAKEFPRVAQDLHRQALEILQEGEGLRRPAEPLNPKEKATVEARLKQLGYLN